MTFPYAGSFSIDGVGVNALSVSAWDASRFGSPPALNDAPPSGVADATATTDPSFGFDGAYVVVLPTADEYYVLVVDSGVNYWQGPVAGAGAGGSGDFPSILGTGSPIAGAVPGAPGGSYQDTDTGALYLYTVTPECGFGGWMQTGGQEYDGSVSPYADPGLGAQGSRIFVASYAGGSAGLTDPASMAEDDWEGIWWQGDYGAYIKVTGGNWDFLNAGYMLLPGLASAPTYVKGGLYFDTTLNKLRIGGATAWETVTSV